MSTNLAFTSFEKDKFKKNRTFVLNMMNAKPSLEGRQFPISFQVAAVSDYFDPKIKEKRIIRYIPGERSIFQDEQTADDKIPKKRQSLSFVNGFLHVDPRETQLLDFIDKCDSNGTNTGRMSKTKPVFYELKLGGAAKVMIEKSKQLMAAGAWALSAEVRELVNYAKVLRVDTNREIEEIRWDMKIIADRDPVKFLEGFDSPVTQRMFHVLYAFENDILIQKQNTIAWAMGGNICVAPVGRDPKDYLVEFTMLNDRGEDTWKAILEAINARENKGTKPEAKVTTESSSSPKKGSDEVDVIIAMAVEQEIVKKSGTWFVYENGETKIKLIGKQFKDHLMKNPEVITELNAKLKEKATV